jgi:hypothetical protein
MWIVVGSQEQPAALYQLILARRDDELEELTDALFGGAIASGQLQRTTLLGEGDQRRSRCIGHIERAD